MYCRTNDGHHAENEECIGARQRLGERWIPPGRRTRTSASNLHYNVIPGKHMTSPQYDSRGRFLTEMIVACYIAGPRHQGGRLHSHRGRLAFHQILLTKSSTQLAIDPFSWKEDRITLSDSTRAAAAATRCLTHIEMLSGHQDWLAVFCHLAGVSKRPHKQNKTIPSPQLHQANEPPQLGQIHALLSIKQGSSLTDGSCV